MANTFDAELLREIVSNTVMTTLGETLAQANLFSTDFSADTYAPKSSVKVGIVTAGASVLTNPTSYESGDSTKESRVVTVNEKSVPFHVTQAQLNEGHRLEHLVKKNAQVLGNAIQDVIMAPITTTNFGAAALDVAIESFAAANMKTIWAAASKFPTKNLLLESLAYAGILPTDTQKFDPALNGAYGFNSIAHSSRFDGAGANTIGFVADPSALAIASGLPVMDSALESALDMSEIIDVGNGLSVRFNTWVSTSTRSRWASLDIMIGAQAGDKTAGKLITDAA